MTAPPLARNHASTKSSTRPTVLALVQFYLPGCRAGGPIRSIANLVHHLGEQYEFLIIASDRDLGSPQPYDEIDLDRWHSIGKARVWYERRTPFSGYRLMQKLRTIPHSALYLNSFFSPLFAILPLALRRLGLLSKRPVILAPRGELSPAALRIKPKKKRLFLAFARRFGLLKGVAWQASSPAEAADIAKAMQMDSDEQLRSVFVAPDLVHLRPHVMSDREAKGAKTRICFLARIARMKNLHIALDVLRQVRCRVQFDIYGPVEDSQYWIECQEFIKQLPVHVEATYRGVVEPEKVPSVLSHYDLLFVPSASENFGHVFIEALCSGVPILVSDQTPWRHLEARGIGWDLPLEQRHDFARAVETVAAMNSVEMRAMREACQVFAKESIGEAPLKLNSALFAAVLPQPYC